MRVSDSSVGGEADQFHTTRWTLVIASARDQSQTARATLAALCQIYWYHLYAFARRCGHSPGDAEDLTQGFFLHVLEHRALSQVDRLKGKVRGVGVGAVKTLIHRLRKQYLAAVREEVARTVSNPAEIEGEIRALWNALIAPEGGVMP